MKDRLSDIGEFALIASLQKNQKYSAKVFCGIGDDTAVLRPVSDRKKRLLFTTDMLAEGVHFTRRMPAKAIGHKALACSVSDIAAMGGIPTCAVISLAAPARLKADFVQRFYQGMRALARRFQIDIVGGDTIGNETIVVNVALLGEVQSNRLILRSGAQEGDFIFVTGPLGRSLSTGKHLTFIPRLNEAQYLVRNFKITSMMDISDGLLSDLGHIVKASQVGASLYAHQIPRYDGARLEDALTDGEDYELLFTLSEKQARKLMRAKAKNMNFHWIGTIIKRKEKIQIFDQEGKIQTISLKGFQHF